MNGSSDGLGEAEYRFELSDIALDVRASDLVRRLGELLMESPLHGARTLPHSGANLSKN